MLTSLEAAEEFGDVIPGFSEAWALALADMFGIYNNPDWDNSVRSQVIQMQAVIHAKQLFAGNPDVQHFKFNNRNIFAVRESGVFMLKQLDENHCTSNYGTPSAKAFDGQEELSGMPEYQRFAIGPVPNLDFTEFVGVYMTSPKAYRQKPNWVLNITGGVPVDIEPLQTLFDEPVTKPSRRFKPLRKQSEKESDGGVA
jgi:hypothetical protein